MSLCQPVPMCVCVRESHSEPKREGVEGMSLKFVELRMSVSGRVLEEGPMWVPGSIPLGMNG